MRLRTLPLSLAGVLMGIFLAAGDGPVNATVIVFTLLTTVGLQILSNLSNELGDFRSGLDRNGGKGPATVCRWADSPCASSASPSPPRLLSAACADF